MTGTACDFNEYSKNIIHDARNLNAMKKWLFGQTSKDCILADISDSGCAVCVPKDQSLSARFFELILMSPADKNTVLMKILIEKRCSNDKFSSTHNKITARFHEMGNETKEDLTAVISLFHDQRNAKIFCRLKQKCLKPGEF